MPDSAAPHPRRKADVATASALLMMVMQVAALIWYASALTSAVENLEAVTTRLEVADTQRSLAVQNLNERVRVLEIQRAADDRRTELTEAEIRRLGGRP